MFRVSSVSREEGSIPKWSIDEIYLDKGYADEHAGLSFKQVLGIQMFVMVLDFRGFCICYACSFFRFLRSLYFFSSPLLFFACELFHFVDVIGYAYLLTKAVSLGNH